MAIYNFLNKTTRIKTESTVVTLFAKQYIYISSSDEDKMTSFSELNSSNCDQETRWSWQNVAALTTQDAFVRHKDAIYTSLLQF